MLVSQSALIAAGINANGCREILRIRLGDSESDDSWSEFFAWFKDGGLSGVDLVASDDHKGLVKAIRRHFQDCPWQRSQTHLRHNVLDACPKILQPELAAELRLLLGAPDEKTARELLKGILDRYSESAPRAMELLESGFEDAIAVMNLPEPYPRKARSANGLERLDLEIRRREHVIGIFPNGESAMRLIGAVLMEQDEAWSTGRKYFDMVAYRE